MVADEGACVFGGAAGVVEVGGGGVGDPLVGPDSELAGRCCPPDTAMAICGGRGWCLARIL